MTTRVVRKIINIDETKCNGCGVCIDSCAEGALALVDGKARLVKEKYCDGLAACLKECPRGALTIVERESEDFDEEATREHLSQLTNWPVQLTLVPPGAPFLKNADVVLLADCVPVAYPALHQDFLKGHAVLMACPKLDDFEAHLAKLTAILKQTELKSLTVVHMEVPCCSGLVYLARQAITRSGRDIPIKEITIGIKGNIKSETGV